MLTPILAGQQGVFRANRSPKEKPASLLLMLTAFHSNPNVLFWKRPSVHQREESEELRNESIKVLIEIRNQELFFKMPIVCVCVIFL